MSPICVAMPVATATPRPRPRVTEVPRHAMSERSASGASRSSAATSLGTGADSPVSGASSSCRSRASVRRRSAGTRSPASSSTTSPGTMSAASTTPLRPSRSTRAVVRVSACRASIDLIARNSMMKPMSVLSASTTATATPSARSPIQSDRPAATTRSQKIAPRNWFARILRGPGKTPRAISFGPKRARRAGTSPVASPRAGSTPKAAATASTSRRWGSFGAAGTPAVIETRRRTRARRAAAGWRRSVPPVSGYVRLISMGTQTTKRGGRAYKGAFGPP